MRNTTKLQQITTIKSKYLKIFLLYNIQHGSPKKSEKI